MNTSDPNLIRGFGIANIVLSALAILAFALLGIFVGIFGNMMTDAALSNQIVNELHHDPYFMYEMDELYAYGYTDIDASDIADIVLLVSGGLAIMIGLGAALSVVSLIAGIMAVRNYKKPEKMGALFGWSIAGAICALICGRVVSVVLLILQTVCVHKQRQIASGAIPAAPAMGAPAGQSAPYGYGYGYGYAPHPGTAHAGYAPQQPYGAHAAGAAPVGYAQPIPNAHPEYPAAAPAPMPQPAPAAAPIPNATQVGASPAAVPSATADKEVAKDAPASTEASAVPAPAEAKDSEENANG